MLAATTQPAKPTEEFNLEFFKKACKVALTDPAEITTLSPEVGAPGSSVGMHRHGASSPRSIQRVIL